MSRSRIPATRDTSPRWSGSPRPYAARRPNATVQLMIAVRGAPHATIGHHRQAHPLAFHAHLIVDDSVAGDALQVEQLGSGRVGVHDQLLVVMG